MKSKNRKCPVCGWEIKDAGQRVNLGGKRVVVCCDDCAEKLKTNPAKYPEAGHDDA